MAKTGYVGEFIPFELQLDDGAVGKYPRAYVYNAQTNLLLDDIAMLPGNSFGTYIAKYLPLATGQVFVTYRVFTSNLYNVLDEYTLGNDSAYIYDRAAERQALSDEILDEPIGDHLTSGSVGKAIADAAAGGGGGGGGYPPELTVERIELLDNLVRLDATVSSRAPESDTDSIIAGIGNILGNIAALSADLPRSGDIWSFATRGLTQPVSVDNVDLSALATTAQLDAARDAIIAELDVWEAKGSITLDKTTDQLELVAWLTKNGEVVTDANSAIIEFRDGDDNLIFNVGPDNLVSVSGLFKFVRGGALAIIQRNKTYVMKISITRGTQTFTGNVSINTY